MQLAFAMRACFAQTCILPIIIFPVIGCAELSPPPHAWYKREGNKAIIGCEDNDKEWTVTCTGTTWDGEIGNCTKSGKDRNCVTTILVIFIGTLDDAFTA